MAKHRNPEQAADNTAADTIEMEAAPKSAEQQLADLQDELAEKNRMIADQASLLAAHDATKGDDTPLVSRESGTYQVLAGARTDKGVFTKKEVAENAEVFDALLAIGFPGIRKVN